MEWQVYDQSHAGCLRGSCRTVIHNPAGRIHHSQPGCLLVSQTLLELELLLERHILHGVAGCGERFACEIERRQDGNSNPPWKAQGS